MGYRFHELRPVDPAVPGLVSVAFLRRAASLCGFSDAELTPIQAAAESLVVELLGWPEATDAARSIARRTYAETIVLDAPSPAVDLARRPANVASLTIDGALADPTSYRVMESAGRVVWRAAWPAPGVDIVVTYAGGFRTPAQGAGDGPPMPAALAEAVLRAAQLIAETAALADGLGAKRSEERFEGVGGWSTLRSGGRAVIEDEIRPMLAPFVAPF